MKGEVLKSNLRVFLTWDETKGKTQERMERRSRKRSSSSRSEKMERVSDKEKKNGRTLFDRPKPTTGCRANGRIRSF